VIFQTKLNIFFAENKKQNDSKIAVQRISSSFAIIYETHTFTLNNFSVELCC